MPRQANASAMRRRASREGEPLILLFVFMSVISFHTGTAGNLARYNAENLDFFVRTADDADDTDKKSDLKRRMKQPSRRCSSALLRDHWTRKVPRMLTA